MKKIILTILTVSVLFPSCISKKDYAALEATNKQNKDLLNTATIKLNACIEDKTNSEASLKTLKDQVAFLKANNQDLINNMGNLTTLSQKGAENLEKSLESMKEKDLTINTMREAVTRRDSVTLALVTSLKGTFIDINDKDIEVNVEKGVVFISISDKLLFNSGSYVVSERAKEVLGKVARAHPRLPRKPPLEVAAAPPCPAAITRVRACEAPECVAPNELNLSWLSYP